MKPIDFLDIEIALWIHQKQILEHGGSDGIRDITLLESALSQAEQSFGGVYLHTNLWDMASAYVYHICQNHPFEDGNKRTALNCAITFLGLNDEHLYKLDQRLFDMMIKVASGQMEKPEISVLLKKIYKENKI